MSGLIDDRRVVDLPLNGRNVIGLARILPGVLNVSAPQQMNDARGGPGMNVNGGRSNMNLFTLNGGYFNNPSRNTGMNYPPPDAVQEVRHPDAQLRRRVWTQSRLAGERGFAGGNKSVPRIRMGVPAQRRAERAELLLIARTGAEAESVRRRGRRADH